MAKKKLTLDDVLVPKEEIPYEVPGNWYWTRLKFIIDKINYGYTESATMEEVGPKFLRITDIKENGVDWNTVPYCTIEDKNYEKYKLNKGDIVVARTGATTGKNYIIEDDVEAVFASYLIRFSLNKEINHKYVSYFMKTQDYWNQIMEERKGIAQPGVNAQKLSNILIPLPPLAEQKRIVNRIESLFDKVDKASELVDEARDGFEKRRAAILERAFCGELTKKWREENGVSDEWETLKLGDLIKEGPQNGLYKPKSAYGEGYLIVRIDNFYDGSINPWNTLKRLQLTDKEIDLYSLDNGDFVVNRVNSIEYLGKSALVRNLSEISVFESNVMRFKIEDGIDREYVIKYMNSPKGLRELRKNAKHAVNQASINQQDVKSADIPIPTLNEQLEIVRILNRVIEEDKESYELSNIDSSIDIIKRSILAKAFRGELGSSCRDSDSSVSLIESIVDIQL